MAKSTLRCNPCDVELITEHEELKAEFLKKHDHLRQKEDALAMYAESALTIADMPKVPNTPKALKLAVSEFSGGLHPPEGVEPGKPIERSKVESLILGVNTAFHDWRLALLDINKAHDIAKDTHAVYEQRRQELLKAVGNEQT